MGGTLALPAIFCTGGPTYQIQGKGGRECCYIVFSQLTLVALDAIVPINTIRKSAHNPKDYA